MKQSPQTLQQELAPWRQELQVGAKSLPPAGHALTEQSINLLYYTVAFTIFNLLLGRATELLQYGLVFYPVKFLACKCIHVHHFTE